MAISARDRCYLSSCVVIQFEHCGEHGRALFGGKIAVIRVGAQDQLLAHRVSMQPERSRSGDK